MVFEKNPKSGNPSSQEGMTMVFSFVPESAESTNLIFQLYRKKAQKSGPGSSSRVRGRFPFSLPIHREAVMGQWEEHIQTEIRSMLESELAKRTNAVKMFQ